MTDNKSKTERMNELKDDLEAHEAREFLANHYNTDTEEFESMSNGTVKEIAQKTRTKAARQNALEGDEFENAVHGNVVSSSREEWEARQEDE